jgi:putative DNA primase/helicase
MKAHLGKYKGLVAALAAIFHVVNVMDQIGANWHTAQSTYDPNGVVTQDELQMALAWATYLETHARRIYGMLHRGKTDVATRLLEHIKAGHLDPDGTMDPTRLGLAKVNQADYPWHCFRAGDIQGKKWEGLHYARDVYDACDALCDGGWLYKEETTPPGGGPVKIRYWINPAALADR